MCAHRSSELLGHFGHVLRTECVVHSQHVVPTDELRLEQLRLGATEKKKTQSQAGLYPNRKNPAVPVELSANGARRPPTMAVMKSKSDREADGCA